MCLNMFFQACPGHQWHLVLAWWKPTLEWEQLQEILHLWLSFLGSLFREKAFKSVFPKWALQPPFLREGLPWFDLQSCNAMQERVWAEGKRVERAAELWNWKGQSLSQREPWFKTLPCPSTEAAIIYIFSAFWGSCIQICACAHELSLCMTIVTVQVEGSPSSTKGQQQ